MKPDMFEAVISGAALEGLLLDPVYSGNCFAGLMDQVHSGTFTDDDNVIFLHTGAPPALFAYTSLFESVLARQPGNDTSSEALKPAEAE